MTCTNTGLHGHYRTKFDMFCRNSGGRTRGHSMKLGKRYARLDVRKYFFAKRVVDMWNGLPEEVVSACSVNAFKNRLDEHWKDLAFDYE